MTAESKRYSRNEEIANSLTHGVGVGLSVAALALLVSYSVIAGDAWRIVSFGIYGTSLIALYLASTIYHAVSDPTRKRFYRILDHSAICFLIAGTYTPISLITLRGAWGWTLFGLIWGFAAAGIILSVFFVGRYQKLTVAIYIAMGWLAIIAIKPMLAAMPTGGMIWLGAGGGFYTGGVVFYVWKKLPFNHAIWHLFVLGGSACHFFCLWYHVLPQR